MYVFFRGIIILFILYYFVVNIKYVNLIENVIEVYLYFLLVKEVRFNFVVNIFFWGIKINLL